MSGSMPLCRASAIHARMSTVSHVRLLPDGERDTALDATERLVARACAEAGETAVPLSHDALCVRWYPEP